MEGGDRGDGGVGGRGREMETLARERGRLVVETMAEIESRGGGVGKCNAPLIGEDC